MNEDSYFEAHFKFIRKGKILAILSAILKSNLKALEVIDNLFKTIPDSAFKFNFDVYSLFYWIIHAFPEEEVRLVGRSNITFANKHFYIDKDVEALLDKEKRQNFFDLKIKTVDIDFTKDSLDITKLSSYKLSTFQIYGQLEEYYKERTITKSPFCLSKIPFEKVKDIYPFFGSLHLIGINNPVIYDPWTDFYYDWTGKWDND